MLIKSSLRIVPVVMLLAFAAIPAQAKGSAAVTIYQSNPGTIDINRTIDPQTLLPQVNPTINATATSPQISTGGLVSSPLEPNTGANGLPLTATNSGAIPASIAGTAVLGATGRDMTECMAAWDIKTHITKSRWREICESTLVESDM